jgi:nucleoside-diphosphate-sugar epimerase
MGGKPLRGSGVYKPRLRALDLPIKQGWRFEVMYHFCFRSTYQRFRVVLTFVPHHRHFEAAEAIFKRYQPHQVLHLAAKVGGVYQNTKYPAEFLSDNLAIDQNVLRLAKEFKVCANPGDRVLQNSRLTS